MSRRMSRELFDAALLQRARLLAVITDQAGKLWWTQNAGDE